jgi:exodeoxyribonuclease VII small subunit
MPVKKINKDSFEYSYNRLEEILDKLETEAEKIPLDEMLQLYNEGLKLLKICRTKLSEAELKIEKINSENK